MGFPVDLAATLTGASTDQLERWRATELLVPEVSRRPVEYSFRDLVALRTFVRLRSEIPLQRIRKAMSTLRSWDLTDHPSLYTFVTDGASVFLIEDVDGTGPGAVDLVRRPGQHLLLTLEDVFAPFTNLQGREVIDFRKPRPRLEVRQQRLGGWPTIEHSRVGYDSVAKLVIGGVAPEDVGRFYPGVGALAAAEAADFQAEVLETAGRAVFQELGA